MTNHQLTIKLPGQRTARASALKNLGVSVWAYPGLTDCKDVPIPDSFAAFPMTNAERFDIIISLLPKYYNKAFEQINIRSKRRVICEPRQHIMWLLDRFTTFNLREVGELLHRGVIKHRRVKPMDHATIIHGIKTWSDIIHTDKKKARLHDNFVADIKALIK